MAGGAALAAAHEAVDPAERRSAEREARHLLAGAAHTPAAGILLAPPDALRACLEGDRARAIAAMRRATPSPNGLLITQLFRRRLGELVQGDEGDGLIAEADAYLRAAGVVDPARFTAALTMGLALR